MELREMTIEEKVDYLWKEFYRLKLALRAWAEGVERVSGKSDGKRKEE